MNPYQYLHSFTKYGNEGGFKPGLHRVREMLSLLGNPEKRLKVIHVAGSNGKGSTIAHLHSIYRTAGYRVGTYISPPLFHFNERMKVGDIPVNTGELTQLVAELGPAIDKMEGEPSFFEVVTVLAFMFFNLRQAEPVLLETGLGGRFDATNVVQKPLVAVLTSISLEHTAILGDNTGQIAREKAGIIKKNCPVISAVRDEEARQVIADRAAKCQASLLEIDKKYKIQKTETTLSGQEFILENDIHRRYKSGLCGHYQVRNAALALAVVEILQSRYPVEEWQLQQGLSQVSWPGRLEVVNRTPLIIIDGAHNREGLENQLLFLQEINQQQNRIFIILGILNDKDIRGIMELFASCSLNIELILSANRSQRSLPPEELQHEADRFGLSSRLVSDLQTAISGTIKKCSKDEIIIITGSFYTVAEAKIILQTGINLQGKT